ncbi:MAG: CYTH and CHAD domain-containing protein [Mycobacteriales bacterium]
MHRTREVETKLTVDDGFEVPDLSGVKGVDHVAPRRLSLRATYWDSEDLRLARSGATLRHRTGEGRGRWTLKLGGAAAGGLDREELSVGGAGQQVPTALADLVTARLRGAPLQPAVVLSTQRASLLLLDSEGRELVEVVHDRVAAVRPDGTATSWQELEVEERPGARRTAERVLALLTEAGAAFGEQTPKAVRALGPAAQAPPDLPLPRPVRGKDAAAELVHHCLADGYHRLVVHDLGVRRGLDDAVHQLRVTCRTLRSHVRTLRPLLDDPRAEQLREELRWLAGSLGAARDLEVLRDEVHELAEQDPLAPLDPGPVDLLLAGREATALAEARAAIGSPRHVALLQLLHDLALDPQLAEAAGRPCQEVLPPLVARAVKRMDKDTGRLKRTDPDASWHHVRILAKRARYTAEAAQVALGKDVRAVAKRAKRTQTVLGEHQDAVVGAERLLALADEHPEAAVLCGRLAERSRSRATALRAALLAER